MQIGGLTVSTCIPKLQSPKTLFKHTISIASSDAFAVAGIANCDLFTDSELLGERVADASYSPQAIAKTDEELAGKQ